MTWREIAELYGITSAPPRSNLQPTYNAAPTQLLPIVRLDGAARVCAIARWGMIPRWAKDPKESKLTTINARAEKLRESPLYRKPFQTRRCIVPATGWYEWRTENDVKQPYAIRVNGQPFGLAGLWDMWRGADGAEIENFTIVTTAAAPAIAELHSRMPRAVVGEEIDQWLSDDIDAAAELLAPSTAEFEFWKVSRAVGNVRNNAPELVEPL